VDRSGKGKNPKDPTKTDITMAVVDKIDDFKSNIFSSVITGLVDQGYLSIEVVDDVDVYRLGSKAEEVRELWDLKPKGKKSYGNV
jgi:hypothetical protein